MPVVVARHAEREDYRMLKLGLNWQASATRPWDTPLTPTGHKQGVALGQGIVEHLERLKLPPVTRIFTSPLLRCAQTAAAAASELMVGSISVEPSLSETICEDWYRSWGVPGANSTWGGPEGSETGTPLPADAAVHPKFRETANKCHNSAEDLAAYMAPGISAAGGSVASERGTGAKIEINLSYVPTFTADKYTWGTFETHEQLEDRMRSFINKVAAQYPTETILCVSHGGPTSASYTALCPKGTFKGVCGYTGMFIYVQKERVGSGGSGSGGDWEALVNGDQSHLSRVGEGTADGPNSLAEQRTKGGE